MDCLGARWRVQFAIVLAATVAAIVCATSLVMAAPAHAAAPFTRALTDDVWFDGIGPQWIRRTMSTGARLALLEIDWTAIEPTPPPPGRDPSDPSGPQYDFSYVDSVVRSFAGTGVSPAFLVTDAPRWAEAPGGPETFEERGSWKPNATAFGQVAAALARRYSGSYPDPLRPGSALPRVRYYQAWAEANFDVHLAPQWTLSGGSWVPTGAQIYRNLLNSFYAGVKSVRSDNVVITAGTGPYGDAPGGHRMPPAMFVREMLCLHGQRMTLESCPNPAHFDVLAQDPYEVSSPTTHAFNVDDVSAPDLGKLTKIVNRAVAVGRALPRAHKQLWVTEFGYDSNPPNPTAVSTGTQARWLEQAFYLFWKQGVSTAVWYLIRDQTGNFNIAYFSGLFFRNGTPKPAYEAFRFPTVVMPWSRRKAIVWGMSPRSGLLTVQRQRGRSWSTVFRIRVSAGSVFSRQISSRLHGNFRAVVGGESSLVWHR